MSSRRGLASIIRAAVLGFGVFIAACPALADAIAVRAAAHDGYGRIVFNWTAPVGYSAVAEGGRLVVRFQRPIESDLGAVNRSLAKFLGAGQIGPDGRSVVFPLKGNLSVRHFYMGSAVVVDVLEPAPGAAQAPPAAAQAAAKTLPPKPARPADRPSQSQAASTGPTVNVRTGEHAAYTRIVFDWPSRVGYQVEKSGTTARIVFNRAVRLNLAALRARLPKFVSGYSVAPVDGGIALTLTVPETSGVRGFLSGSKVVVDVSAPKEPSKAPAPKVVEKAAPRVPAQGDKPPESEKAAAAKAPSPTVNAPRNSAIGTAAPKAVAPPASGPQKLAGLPAPDTRAPGAAARPESEPPQNVVPKDGPKEADDKPAVGAPGRPLALTPNADGAKDVAAPKADPPVLSDVSERTVLTRAVTATPIQGGGAVSLQFDWKEPVAAAVFRRAGSLWVIFDKNAPVEIPKLLAAGGNVIRSIDRVPVERATVLRFDTVAGVNPVLKRNGLSWILEFGKRALQPPTPIEMNAQLNSPVGARIFMPVPEPGNALAITDPTVGDTLVVIPIIPLGHGIGQARNYAQMTLLPTAQGIVVKPKIDDLRVRSLPQGVELTSATKLQISEVARDLAASASAGLLRPLTRLFELERSGRETTANFYSTRQRLQLAVAKAKGTGRDKARDALSQFYFSHGYGAEALGVMAMSLTANEEAANDPKFLGMRGAASLLQGRFGEAKKDLMNAVLEKNDEASFWRAAVLAAEGEFATAAPVFKRVGSIIRPYPKALKMPLGLWMIESAIAVGDVRQAERFLEIIRGEKPSPGEKSRMNLLVGRLKEVSGEFDVAVGSYEQSQDGQRGPSQAKAGVARAELLFKLGKMTRAEVIEEYEKLRFTWRDGDFEFNLLRRLGRLYLEEGDYRNGLRTLRQAATYFRDHPKVKEVTELMAESFANIFLGGASLKLKPVSAIALYDEFKELTPAGARGDALVRRLADRLVSIELFDRAASLLETQIQFRLKGVERGQVATRLALIYFIAKTPDKALKTLDATEVAGMPDVLRKVRRLLRARILTDLKRVPDALALLKDDKSVEADILRLEIYWNRSDWRSAALTLRELVIASKAESGKPLNEQQSSFILNYAIALTLSGNQRGVNLLRRDFGQAMAETASRDAFVLIASPETQGLLDYRTIAEKVNVAEKFQDFMAAYRKRMTDKFAQSIQSPGGSAPKAGDAPKGNIASK